LECPGGGDPELAASGVGQGEGIQAGEVRQRIRMALRCLAIGGQQLGVGRSGKCLGAGVGMGLQCHPCEGTWETWLCVDLFSPWSLGCVDSRAVSGLRRARHSYTGCRDLAEWVGPGHTPLQDLLP
jgi:hypothetical protein